MRIFNKKLFFFFVALCVPAILMSPSKAEEADAHTIVVLEKRLSYGKDIKARVGQTIKVVNPSRLLHVTTVKRYDKGQKTGDIVVSRNNDVPGSSFQFTLDKKGLYKLTCLLHTGMKMEIEVE